MSEKVDIEEHYLNPEVKDIILTWSHIKHPKARRSLIAGHSGWYRYKENSRALVPANERGYERQIERMLREDKRSLYHSLNYFDPLLFNEWVDKDEDESPGGYEETIYYTLGTDIDLKDKEKIDLDRDRGVTYKEDREWLEKAVKYHIEWLEDQGVSKDIIKNYFSGNGCYVVLDPRIGRFKNDPVKRETVCRAYNLIIKKIEEDFFKEYPEAREYVQFDALNNSKRQWKTPLSIHKSKNFACIPLDPEDPEIDLERASLPLSEEVLKDTREWIQLIDPEETEPYITELGELLQKPILDGESPKDRAKDKIYEGAGADVEPLDVDLDLQDKDKFPPCIRKLISQMEREESDPVLSHARGKALLSLFLSKIGMDKEKAREKWVKLCKAAGGSRTNIFESFYSEDLSLPKCETIQEKGSGFPAMNFGELGLCEKDEKCEYDYVKSPKDYVRGTDKEFLIEVAQALDDRCDGARTKDDVGFNKYDADFVPELLEEFEEKGDLTVKQCESLKKKLEKYQGEIEDIGYDWKRYENLDFEEDLKPETKQKIEDKIFNLNKKCWNCRTEVVTFTNEIDFDSGRGVNFSDTYELPKEQAEKLIDKNMASKGIWKCESCGNFHYQKRKPYSCMNEDCDSSKFIPIHPQSYHEIGDTLRENYRFAVPLESMSERKAGQVHIYEKGVYKYKGVKGFIRNKVKKINHLSKQSDQSHVIDHIATLESHPIDDFGLDGSKVVLKDGILDLETFEMEDHDPDALAMSKIDIEFDPEADCPKFFEYLEEVVPNERDRTRLKEFLGTALVNEKLHKKGVILVGPTDAGKSTFVEIIDSIIGEENISHQGPSTLSNSRWGKAKLRGKLLNTTDEVRASKLKNLAILKKILDGNNIEAERKGEKTFEFAPTCEHIFCANQTPTAKRKDDAFWNRWIPIEIPHKIPEDQIDPRLPEKILKERKGIFNWIVEGYRQFIENGRRFTHPVDWEEARDKWLNWGDSIQRFIQQCIGEEEGNKITSKELHEHYSDFAKQHNLDIEGQKKLTEEVKKISYASYSDSYRFDGKMERGFKNIKIKDELNTVNTENNQSLWCVEKKKGEEGNSKIDEYGKNRVNRGQKTLRDSIIDSLRDNDEKLIDEIYEDIEDYDLKELEKELERMNTEGLIRVEEKNRAKFYSLA